MKIRLVERLKVKALSLSSSTAKRKKKKKKKRKKLEFKLKKLVNFKAHADILMLKGFHYIIRENKRVGAF
jgi:hypothetical protein